MSLARRSLGGAGTRGLDFVWLSLCSFSARRSCAVGVRVVLSVDCQSDDTKPVALVRGETGTIKSLDAEGDCRIQFDSRNKANWIFQEHFGNFRVSSRPWEVSVRQPYLSATPKSASP